jgi:hypothetical protein
MRFTAASAYALERNGTPELRPRCNCGEIHRSHRRLLESRLKLWPYRCERCGQSSGRSTLQTVAELSAQGYPEERAREIPLFVPSHSFQESKMQHASPSTCRLAMSSCIRIT